MALRAVRLRLPLGDTFASLRFPNYRLWFFGQMISLMGTWMQSSAQSFLIYDLTGSAQYVGYIWFANGIPVVLLTLFAGLAADRFPRRRLMVIIQSGMMLLAFVQAWLTFTGQMQPAYLLVMAFLLGILNAFDGPIRLSFVPELVDRPHLTNAIALNATMFTSAIVVGPAISGLVYNQFGPAWCFLINALSFVFVISALLRMKLPEFQPVARKKDILGDISEGVRYVLSHSDVLMLMGVVGAVGVFGFGMVSVMPAWAVEVLGGDAGTNGLLLAARGGGSLVAALTLATLGQRMRRGWLVLLAISLMPLFVFAFSLTRIQGLSMLAIFAVGWTLILNNNSCNALVQSAAPDQLRGRVMSVFTLILFGSSPLGSLLISTVAEYRGVPAAVQVSAAGLTLMAALLWLLAPKVRALA